MIMDLLLPSHAHIMVGNLTMRVSLCSGCGRFSSRKSIKINLTEIPCEIYGGFIWYNMDEDCAPLFDFLGEVKEYFDMHNLNV